MLLFLFIGQKIYFIYPIVFLYSFLNLFYYPAESSAIPWLVKNEDLTVANSLFLLTSQTALVVGLGFSGILMRFLGKSSPIYISSFCLFLAAAAVWSLPKKEPKKEGFSLFGFMSSSKNDEEKNRATAAKAKASSHAINKKHSVIIEDEEEEKAVKIPKEVKEKDALSLKKTDPKQHFTQPPARYTQATLVKELEKRGK